MKTALSIPPVSQNNIFMANKMVNIELLSTSKLAQTPASDGQIMHN